MKPLGVVRALPVGANIGISDNTGARIIQIISVLRYKGVRGRLPSAGVGDMVVASVKRCTSEFKKEIVHAVVIRQKKEYRRPEGIHVKFEDNAAVLVTPEGDPRGSDIKGPVAKEAAERWPSIAGAASIII
ncbi:MAG: 50S ribosomal protein L14 [Euryarchaeota archaeon]|nr:50S ribosomal protein L14 [Euryarchaeota archaeon]